MVTTLQDLYNSEVDRLITALFFSFLVIGGFCLFRLLLADLEWRKEDCARKARIRRFGEIRKTMK